jgi:hypothetical protein
LQSPVQPEHCSILKTSILEYVLETDLKRQTEASQVRCRRPAEFDAADFAVFASIWTKDHYNKRRQERPVLTAGRPRTVSFLLLTLSGTSCFWALNRMAQRTS